MLTEKLKKDNPLGFEADPVKPGLLIFSWQSGDML